MSRISWPRYAIELAKIAASRSEDPHLKVGAVALRHDNSVAGIGYNGAPAGIDLDWTDRDGRRPFVVHAEANALRYCQPNEIKLIASTLMPCASCLSIIASYNIRQVFFQDIHDGITKDEVSQKIAEKFQMQLLQIDAWEKSSKHKNTGGHCNLCRN